MLEPDFTQAAAFVECLSGTDGWHTWMTWQVFDDTPAKRVELAHIFNGRLADVAEDLRYFNNRGAGIFVTVARTNLNGRTWDCIEEPRAAFVDIDDDEPRTFPLAPSMVVRTANGQHAYWRLAPQQDLAEVCDTQKQLAAYYRSDPSVSDITRVMRVPGFFHCKSSPTPVVITKIDRKHRYTMEQVRRAHPVEMPKPAPTKWRVQPTHSLKAFHNWAMCKPMTEGGRNRNAFIIAAEGLSRGFDPCDVDTVVLDYCNRSGLSESEGRAVMGSAIRRHARAS